MNYYGIYQFFIDIYFQETNVLIGLEKATHSEDVISNYLINNIPEENRDFVKGYLTVIECTKSAFIKVENSDIISKNKKRLGIWA